MKYSINLRMKKPGPAKYLIDSREEDNFMEAFRAATRMAAEIDNDHFVEIFDNDINERVADFNGRVQPTKESYV